MASRSSYKRKPYALSLLFLTLILIFLIHTSDFRPKEFRPKPIRNVIRDDHSSGASNLVMQTPAWYDVVKKVIKKERLKLGLVNVKVNEIQGLSLSDSFVNVKFDRVGDDQIKWTDLFPEWVDEDEKWSPMHCPSIPMPRFEDYGAVDVVVARVPEGVRDVFRLQVNLVVANMLVRSGWESHRHNDHNQTVYVVFVGSSGPMWEIFRCDDMVWHEGEYRIYKPDLYRLKHKVEMPVGSCQIAPSIPQSSDQPSASPSNINIRPTREAYVTLLHSSETYVCGAIALAQSIIQTNSTKDLLLLADATISPKSVRGLEAAGWKVTRIDRIRSPHAKAGAYNEYNYSKLRIWQLTEYDKVIFIDSDLIVLKNIDRLFSYPQLSAAGNDKVLFNSGVMLIEPSECMFKALMDKRFTLGSYNGGDQGFLNEAFTWWHRWHSKMNHLKIFNKKGMENSQKRDVSEDLHTLHYLGLKPWMCYRDYDCNWDVSNYRPFASDSAHRKWWRVYDGMDSKLKGYCRLTRTMEERIRKWKGIAGNASFSDGHWKINVKDKRSHFSA